MICVDITAAIATNNNNNMAILDAMFSKQLFFLEQSMIWLVSLFWKKYENKKSSSAF